MKDLWNIIKKTFLIEPQFWFVFVSTWLVTTAIVFCLGRLF